MLFKHLKFRNKLLASFLSAFVPLILIGGTIGYLQTKKILETSIENELSQTTASLANLIQTAANISIQNRLRAIAEKNYDIAEYYYSKHRSGLLTREQAIQTIEEIFLNQPIGISGYIYCLDSKGKVIIHPNDRVKGTNVSSFDFVKQQIQTKEGYLEYGWKNPEEANKRPKALYMVYFKPLDWIISVSSYRKEFHYLVDIKDFRQTILSFKTGKSGYAFLMDEAGTALIHPSLEGKNLIQHDDNSQKILYQIIGQKNGKLRYSWQNPDEIHPRKKFILFKYLPEFNWIIGSTSYENEVLAPLHTFKTIIAAVLAIILLLGILLTFYISRSVTKPLDKLLQKLETGSQGDFSVRMAHESPDELGKVSRHFNTFMDRLENYHEKLNKEIKKTTQAQAALVESELKFRGIFNQSFQYTGILSPGGILEQVNQSALEFGKCTEAEVLNKPFWDTLWWSHDPNSQRALKEAIQKTLKGELVRMETTNINKNGDIKNVDVTIKPIFNTANQIEFLIVESRDITNLKQAEFERHHLAVQLEKSQRMEAIGTLAGGIAHDFNNILSSIFGYAQLAEMTLHTPERAKNHIAQIVKGAQRATGLIQQILTFSRQTEFKKHPLKIHLVIKEALKLLRSSLPTTIDIQVNILSKSMVMADPTQMHQVIMNLCTNAYHSMLETGGSLSVQLQEIGPTEHHKQPVSLKGSGPYLKIQVKDTGHGMDQNTLKKAFDPYFTTKEMGRGTGLGLSLVHAIIEEHEGVIHVESQPGMGTIFSLYLPVVEKNTCATKPRKNIIESPRQGKETIMVVDDDEDIRTLTMDLLESFGYTVQSFKNGEAALVHFKQNPDQFDLIITDMTMPRMTGYELAKAVLQTRKEMPIILCTGYSETISETLALEIGIRRYLQKPLQNKDLLFTIQEVLDAS